MAEVVGIGFGNFVFFRIANQIPLFLPTFGWLSGEDDVLQVVLSVQYLSVEGF